MTVRWRSGADLKGFRQSRSERSLLIRKPASRRATSALATQDASADANPRRRLPRNEQSGHPRKAVVARPLSDRSSCANDPRRRIGPTPRERLPRPLLTPGSPKHPGVSTRSDAPCAMTAVVEFGREHKLGRQPANDGNRPAERCIASSQSGFADCDRRRPRRRVARRHRICCSRRSVIETPARFTSMSTSGAVASQWVIGL